MNNEMNAGTTFPKHISPEEMREIFDSTVLYLINKRYDFTISNGEDTINYIQLECPDLMLALSLTLPARLSQDELRCKSDYKTGRYRVFQVVDFAEIIAEIKEKEKELKSNNPEKKK